GISCVVVSTQHSRDVKHSEIRSFIVEEVIKKVLPPEMLNESTQFLVNPTGNFVVGGPQGDTGLTGRKIIVDSYGGMGRHGGRAVLATFSFKPADIIKQLDLLRPIYSKTTNYGHFGKVDDPDITWEKTDKAAELKKAAK